MIPIFKYTEWADRVDIRVKFSGENISIACTQTDHSLSNSYWLSPCKVSTETPKAWSCSTLSAVRTLEGLRVSKSVDTIRQGQ